MKISFETDTHTADAIVKAIADLIETEAPVLIDLDPAFAGVAQMIRARHESLRDIAATIERQTHSEPAPFFDQRETRIDGPWAWMTHR